MLRYLHLGIRYMAPEMLSKLIPSSLALGFIPLLATPVFAQLAYQGVRQDVQYKVFIYQKKSIGNGRWEFQTKTVYDDGSKPYYSNWQIADCFNSTIDGQVIRAISQYGYQEGESAVLLAVCGRGQR